MPVVSDRERRTQGLLEALRHWPDSPAILASLLDLHGGLLLRVLGRLKLPAHLRGQAGKDDLLQEGRLAILRAARHYDPTRGRTFTAYAARGIYRSYVKLCDSVGRERSLVGLPACCAD